MGPSSSMTMWEGVPPSVLWLVQSQVRLLLQHHAALLLHRPDAQFLGDEDDGDAESGEIKTRLAQLDPHDQVLAQCALRDKAIGARLQRAIDWLVPTHLTEGDFWDNFFSHVDVIKVRVVTDYLVTKEAAAAERTTKHETWVQLHNSMDPEMRSDLRRASLRIASRQQPPPPSTAELAMGFDASRTPRWTADSEAWLEYIEDGPHEVAKVLNAAQDASDATAAATHSEENAQPLFRSPGRPNDKLDNRSVEGGAASTESSGVVEVEQTLIPIVSFESLVPSAPHEPPGQVAIS